MTKGMKTERRAGSHVAFDCRSDFAKKSRGQGVALKPHTEKLGYTNAHQEDHPNEHYAAIDLPFARMAFVLALNFH